MTESTAIRSIIKIDKEELTKVIILNHKDLFKNNAMFVNTMRALIDVKNISLEGLINIIATICKQNEHLTELVKCSHSIKFN